MAFQPLLDFLSESAGTTEQQGSLAGSVRYCVLPLLYLWDLLLLHCKSSQFFLSSVLNLKSCRIGLRVKSLSKHPCPETTLQGMNK